MKIYVDKTGFPLLEVDEAGSFNLWPIAKLQFERFIYETNQYGDSWYETVLLLNPRVSYRHLDRNNYERFFISGVLPDEALNFSKWFGEGFDLPTIKEWRMLNNLLKSERTLKLPEMELSVPACTLCQNMSVFSSTPQEFALMKNGLVEWVKDNGRCVGVGQPRFTFQPNVWNPEIEEIESIKIGDRHLYFGFRLIKRDKGDYN